VTLIFIHYFFKQIQPDNIDDSTHDEVLQELREAARILDALVQMTTTMQQQLNKAVKKLT
jgi:hypothetical protein